MFNKNNVIVVGAPLTGKTSLVWKILNKKQPIEETIGIDGHKLPLLDLMIWDCSGRDSYRSLVPGYGSICDVIIAVYDVSKSQTFGHELLCWINEARSLNNKIPVLVVGLKIDKRCLYKKGVDYVSTLQGQQFAREHGFLFLETSAQTCSQGELENAVLDLLIPPVINSARPLRHE